MKLAKWGNSLAVRIPAEVVAKLGIAPNEEVEVEVTGENSFEVRRDRRRQEALEAIRKLRRPLPPGFKFDREEAHERGSYTEGARTEP
jgi:antitoxin MazE